MDFNDPFINQQWYFMYLILLVVFDQVVLSLVCLYVVFVSLPLLSTNFPFGTNKVLN